MNPNDYDLALYRQAEEMVGDDGECRECGAEVAWADCDLGHADCYQAECDTPLGCGFIDRDCEDDEARHPGASGGE